MTLFDMYLCTLHDTVLGIQRPLRRQHCSSLHRASTPCQTTLPASCSAALSYELTAIHSCFSCFQCSAMQKINSSGYSASTQASLNTTSIHFPPSLFLSLSLSPGHTIRMTFPLHPLIINIHLHLHISSSQSHAHSSICTLTQISHTV